jgi:acetolactate synthase-1/2/3 large subunit
LWNRDRPRPIVHIDAVACDIDMAYRPRVEITGDIAATLRALAPLLPSPRPEPGVDDVVGELETIRKLGARESAYPVHPLRLVADLQSVIDDEVTLCLDMGSFHIWIAAISRFSNRGRC